MKNLITLLFFVLAAGTFDRAAAQQLIFADSVQTIRDVAENDPPHTYRFVCENRSDKPVVILHVDTSCGCVKVTHTRKPIGPGESGEVIVKLDPRGHEGALYKQMPVYTSDSGNRPAVRLALSGVIKPPRPKEKAAGKQ